jgi:hypothetical protein
VVRMRGPAGADLSHELDLLRQHVSVLFTIGDDGRMEALNEPDGDPPPRLFLARGRRTHLILFRGDVAPGSADACRSIADDVPPWRGEPSMPSMFDPFRLAIGRDAPIASEAMGPAYRFGERVQLPVDPEVMLIDEGSAHLLERHFPYTRSVLAWRTPVVGVVKDGRVVSACFSARKTSSASEAGVATEEPYRGQGLASLAVAAWCDAVERAGMQPLYSTSWDNVASRAVARRLHLVAYAETLSIP